MNHRKCRDCGQQIAEGAYCVSCERRFGSEHRTGLAVAVVFIFAFLVFAILWEIGKGG